jgi:Leucine-rich repeat (LRR) protein
MFNLAEWEALNATEDANYETLKMDHNRLEKIDLPFPSLKFALKKIDFSHNNISQIVKNAFTNLSYVNEIDLSFNDLKANTLKPNVFEGRYSADEYEPITSLKVLRLSYNLLHNLDQDIFEHITHLQELYLDNNPIQIIHTSVLNAFSDIPELQVLDISRCELTDLPTDIFHPLRALKTLKLEGNLFRNIPKALAYAKNVREVALDDNPIEDIGEENPFPPMPNLERLNLTFIGSLRRIKKGAFAGLERLNELRLSHNHHLSFIDPSAFTFPEKDDSERLQWPPIRKLFLNNNNLTTLEETTFINWEDMKEVHIHDNPWVCDCEIQWIVTQLMPIIKRTTSHSIDSVKCANPEAHVDKLLMDLSESEHHMGCQNKSHPERDSALLVALFIGVVLGMPLTLACVLIYKRLCGRQDRGAAKYSRAFYKRADAGDDMHI